MDFKKLVEFVQKSFEQAETMSNEAKDNNSVCVAIGMMKAYNHILGFIYNEDKK